MNRRRLWDSLGTLRLALVLAVVISGCASTSPIGFGSSNDPVPLPDDLARVLADWMSGDREHLDPVGASAPRISPDRAVELAGQALLADLRGIKVADEDVSSPDGLIRRHYVNPSAGLTANVWLVVYRHKAGLDCKTLHAPGTCPVVSYMFVDDRSGDVVNLIRMRL